MDSVLERLEEELRPNALAVNSGQLVHVVGGPVQWTYCGLGSRFVKGVPWMVVRTPQGVLTVIDSADLEAYSPPLEVADA